MANSNPIVGRLAPSPTGGLHLGHARTFLIAWLAARSVEGRVVLRIEDIDTGRVRPGMAELARDDLRWLGLDWDEGPDLGGPNAPYLQSNRLERYEEALARLRADELVYPCTCTRADIARLASAPHAEDEGVTYPGTCSSRRAVDGKELADSGRPFAWRFRVPAGEVEWDDLYRGNSRLDPSRVGGDFLVARQGIGPSYQLAVVVDDAAMGINQVLRGDDLMASSPRQILLHRGLGFVPPRFGHVPLVVGPNGVRLAKRDQSIKLASLRESGVDPRRIVGLVATSCGWANQTERMTPREVLDRFDLGTIPSDPWRADIGALE